MHLQPLDRWAEDAHLPQAGGGGNGGQEAREAQPTTALDALDDVFGSPPELQEQQGDAHPSDMRRLQTEHETAGYREGITAAKESHMQEGFDEGFSLGATLGLRAGQLLGTLEAIADAVKGQADGAAAAAQRLLDEARQDLSTGRVFDPEYWAPDGNWTYEVEPAGGDEILFRHVADAHPLMRKWSGVVGEQVELWKIDQAILDEETGPRLNATVEEAPLSPAPSAASKPLDW